LPCGKASGKYIKEKWLIGKKQILAGRKFKISVSIDNMISQHLRGLPKFVYVGEYQNKVKLKFSTFSRQHFSCTGPSRF